MLKDSYNKIPNMTLEEFNPMAMDIARELVMQGFDMEQLANVEANIMELAEARIRELRPDVDFTDPKVGLCFAGLMIEMSLAIGVTIGRENSHEQQNSA